MSHSEFRGPLKQTKGLSDEHSVEFVVILLMLPLIQAAIEPSGSALDERATAQTVAAQPSESTEALRSVPSVRHESGHLFILPPEDAKLTMRVVRLPKSSGARSPSSAEADPGGEAAREKYSVIVSAP